MRFFALSSPRCWVGAVSAQNDKFKGSFHSSYSRLGDGGGGGGEGSNEKRIEE